MIVVDSNVIAYCWIHGERTAIAHRARKADPDWHAPLLWRSELRSILTGYQRDGSLTMEQARQIMSAAETGLAGREHHLPSNRVFDVVEHSRLSAYDGEFIALADVLAVPLVTEDRAILSAFPSRAVNLARFLDAAERR